ncbi:MAG: hypothetical protein QM662_06700 [Gordonia sp. (in: high G+C Gram-positive bacteria)]
MLTTALALAGVVSPVCAQAAPPSLPEPLHSWLASPVPRGDQLTGRFGQFQRALAKSLPGVIGVSVVPVGSDAAISLGRFRTGWAWSTLKVPVSLAAERRLGTRVAGTTARAIRFSDNDAAEVLWGKLGSNHSAVDAVTAVLREGHDTTTHVSSQEDHPPSYPGYTMWALADQARFAAHLPCMADTTRLLRLMSSVGPNQRWGVANLARTTDGVVSTAVKGGWGPGTGRSSAYLVRQMAIVSTTRGEFAVAMAAVPRSGEFDDGTAMLTRIGTWLGRNLASIPVGGCVRG